MMVHDDRTSDWEYSTKWVEPQPFWRFEPFPVFLYQLGSSSENGEKEHISGLNWKELELDAITKSIQR